jgi:hypothetical protein
VAAVLWLDKAIASAPDTIALMRAKLPDDVKQECDSFLAESRQPART